MKRFFTRIYKNESESIMYVVDDLFLSTSCFLTDLSTFFVKYLKSVKCVMLFKFSTKLTTVKRVNNVFS